ncbi:unnamed protein product [Trichobilharzia szidati]|nr:unnamed protein product [Trichobilharzia szidati]
MFPTQPWLHDITMRIFITFLVICTSLHQTFTKPLDIESDTPLTISFNPPADQVLLNEPLIIRCEVNTMNNERLDSSNKNILSGYSMFFLCPIAPWGKFCFHNCQSACVGENPGKCPYENELGLVKCRTVVTQEGHIFYEYTIPSLTKPWLGLDLSDSKNPSNNNDDIAGRDNEKKKGFSCKTAGLKTPNIQLILAKPPVTTPKPVQLPPLTTQPAKTLTVINPTNKSISDKSGKLNQDAVNPKTQEDVNQSIRAINADLKAALTREILIVGAVIIVFISVIVNVFCCIRCALIRQYSKTKDRVHMQHLFCMAEEIRNARIVKQINGKGRSYRDRLESHQSSHYQQQQQQQQQLRLTNLLHDGSTPGGGSSLLMMNKIQPQVNGYESYQPSVDYGSEYVTSLNCPVVGYSDNQSSGLPADINLRYLPDGKSGNRQSMSAFSLVHGQLPMIWPNGNNNNNISSDLHRRSISSVQRGGGNSISSHASQQQIAAAVTNFYLQHQQHFMELQNHLNNTTAETSTVNQIGSEGMGSCFGSIGQPDSSILSDLNVIPTNSGGPDSGNGDSIITSNLVNNNNSPVTMNRSNGNNNNNNSNNVFLKGKSSPSRTSITTVNNQSNYLISTDHTFNPTNQISANFRNVSPIVNRSQPIGSSQSQLAVLMNKLNYTNSSNPQILANMCTNASTPVGTLNSQSDSGAGSGSGKVSIDSSENRINPSKNDYVIYNPSDMQVVDNK